MKNWKDPYFLRQYINKTCSQYFDRNTWNEVESAYLANKQRPHFAWLNPSLTDLSKRLWREKASEVIEWERLQGLLFNRKLKYNPFFGDRKFRPLIFMSLSSALSIEALKLDEPFQGSPDSRCMRVLDMCASPGAKTCLIAWTCKKNSLIIANEVLCERRWRLHETIQNYVTNRDITCDISSLDGIDFGDFFESRFDRVLVDAPCLNERYLFHNRVTPEQVFRSQDDLSLLQKQLLLSAIRSCKVGGYVVYSTCTLDKRQNCDVIDWLLSESSVQSCVVVEHVDVSRIFENFLNVRRLGNGVLVVPTVQRNWGPLFVCRLKKTVDHNSENLMSDCALLM